MSRKGVLDTTVDELTSVEIMFILFELSVNLPGEPSFKIEHQWAGCRRPALAADRTNGVKSNRRDSQERKTHLQEEYTFKKRV